MNPSQSSLFKALESVHDNCLSQSQQEQEMEGNHYIFGFFFVLFFSRFPWIYFCQWNFVICLLEQLFSMHLLRGVSVCFPCLCTTFSLYLNFYGSLAISTLICNDELFSSSNYTEVAFSFTNWRLLLASFPTKQQSEGMKIRTIWRKQCLSLSW